MVLGSGNCWPQDFLFSKDFFSGADVPARLPSIESWNTSSSWYDSGVMASLGSIESILSKRDGHCVPGVETKESAGLSMGEFSNLICGVDILNREVTLFH